MIVVDRITSRHLAGSLLGDPSERDLLVYVPTFRNEQRMPVLILLHGFGERVGSWTNGPVIRGGSSRPSIETVLDELFADRDVPAMIVAMPDGWSHYGCSQWVDSTVNGNFERYVTEEVIERLDERYPTIPTAASRGVFGISSGGLGAWQLGSLHPEVFGAVAVLSGDSYFDYTHRAWLYALLAAWSPDDPNGPIAGHPDSWLVYALASSYTPNRNRPPYFVDLPVEYGTGELIPELWDRWLSFDPIVNYASRIANLRALRGILLDVGVQDEYGFQYGHRILSRRLDQAGIPHLAREHAGGHVSHLAERIDLAVRWFGRTLASGAD